MNINQLKLNTITKLQNAGIEKNEAKIETEILLNFVFNLTKKDILLNPEKELPADKIQAFEELAQKRISKKIPVQYLTNRAYFMGEEFYVDNNVLIPRPETELLVEEVIRLYKEQPHFIERNNTPSHNPIKIVDIGTGSGCIACMLAKFSDNSIIYASDISQKILEITQFNAKKLEINDKIVFIISNILQNINETFDIIVSNPPYISLDEKPTLQEEVVLHEPHLALFAKDKKGVSFYEKLANQAIEKLNKDGFLAVEIGFSQADDVSKIFTEAGFSDIKVIKDYNGRDRIITAVKY